MSFDALANIAEFRPLERPANPASSYGRRASPFSAPWHATVSTLTKEIRHLKPRQTIIEVDIRDQDFRLDGMPRANARQQSPAVVLTLISTPHGDLRYPCDSFRDWQDNLRAIALGLEALRKVDRYGVTKHGEQYKGWKQLASGSTDGDGERGRRLVSDEFGGNLNKALRATHPDTRGPGENDEVTDKDFKDVMAYKRLTQGTGRS